MCSNVNSISIGRKITDLRSAHLASLNALHDTRELRHLLRIRHHYPWRHVTQQQMISRSRYGNIYDLLSPINIIVGSRRLYVSLIFLRFKEKSEESRGWRISSRSVCLWAWFRWTDSSLCGSSHETFMVSHIINRDQMKWLKLNHYTENHQYNPSTHSQDHLHVIIIMIWRLQNCPVIVPCRTDTWKNICVAVIDRELKGWLNLSLFTLICTRYHEYALIRTKKYITISMFT